MFRCVYCGLIVAVLFVPPVALAQQADGLAAALALQQTLQEAIARAEHGVVSIAKVKPAPPAVVFHRLDAFPEAQPERPRDPSSDPDQPDFIPTEFGGGVLIAGPVGETDVLILTNYHLVRGGTRFEPSKDGGPPPATARGGEESRTTTQSRLFVKFPDRRSCEARIFAADPRSDLAVLKPDLEPARIPPEALKPIELGDATDLRKGTFVLALGNPYAIGRDGSASASWGIVSNTSRRPAPFLERTGEDLRGPGQPTIHQFGTLLHVDTRLNLGASGGALLDLQGRLIGMTTALAALEGYEKSVGFAIPLDRGMRRAVEALAQGHEVEYGFLGLEPMTVPPDRMRLLSSKFNQPTAAGIHNVFAGSPAERAGVRRGDVILAVNDRPVFDEFDLIREVGLLGPEARVRLTVWRESLRRELSLEAELGKWPVYDDEGIIASRPRYPTWRGLQVDYPTGRAKYYQLPFEVPRAVVVTQVEAGLSDRLQPGDFISHVESRPVDTPAQFHDAVARAGVKSVKLRLVDGRVVEIAR